MTLDQLKLQIETTLCTTEKQTLPVASDLQGDGVDKQSAHSRSTLDIHTTDHLAFPCTHYRCMLASLLG
jgi:hypothetical protein